jgi:TolB-like protein/class 3 adenylate cyclase
MVVGDNSPGAPARRPGLIRRLAAVLAWDISGYSAMMGRNEEATHRRVGAEVTRIAKDIERAKGRIFSFAGEGLMAEFPSAVEAVKCALRIGAESRKRNAKLPTNEQIWYRIGINSGEIMVHNGRTGGNAVNVAARLEQAADAGSIYLSRAVYDQVNRVVPADYVWVGERRLKNIRESVTIYMIGAEASEPVPELYGTTSSVSAVDIDADYRPSLAVLPFRTLQSVQADTYFAEGMVDDIVRMLGGLKDLIVVSRSSTMGYAGATPDIQKISRELNVSYVLRGSVRRAGDQLRIAVELVDARTHQSIWADRFDGSMADIFDLQDRIALQTASLIAPYVRERELRRASYKDRNTITAYDLTLQALDQLYVRDPEALSRAQDLLKRAIALDSNYPTALTHLAYLQLFRIGQGWSLNEHADRLAAAEAAQLAVERDHNDALALAIHGHLRGFLNKEHEAALNILERAIAIGPSCALAWTFNSYVCGWIGEPAAAVERARQGLRLSPIGPDAGCWHEHALSQAYYMAGQYDEAVAWARTAASHGRQLSNLRCLAASLVALDQMDEARIVALEIMQAKPDFGLRVYQTQTPLKGQIADVFVDRLRRAGLPE